MVTDVTASAVGASGSAVRVHMGRVEPEPFFELVVRWDDEWIVSVEEVRVADGRPGPEREVDVGRGAEGGPAEQEGGTECEARSPPMLP